MPTPIVISYKNNPPGQLGERPRRLKPGTEIQFTSGEGNDLVVRFPGKSPLNNGSALVRQNEVVTVADKPGRYPFLCTMTVNGKPVTLGDPSDPGIPAGGELEIAP
jgi:hypothetical protein